MLLFASIFFILFIINSNDERKADIASLFFWVNLLNCFTDFQGINFYLMAIIPTALIILVCLQNSQRNWSMVICGIMTSCIFINILGMINFSYLEIDSGFDLYERATYLTTIAEITVLLAMPTRLLDGYVTDNFKRIREYLSRHLFIRFNNYPHLQRVF